MSAGGSGSECELPHRPVDPRVRDRPLFLPLQVTDAHPVPRPLGARVADADRGKPVASAAREVLLHVDPAEVDPDAAGCGRRRDENEHERCDDERPQHGTTRLRKCLVTTSPPFVLGLPIEAGTIGPGESPDFQGQLGARADAELAVDLRQVPLDGLRADVESGSHLLVREAAARKLRYPALRIRQLLEHEPSVSPRIRGFPRV